MLIEDLRKGVIVNKDNIEAALAEIEVLGIKWTDGDEFPTEWNPYEKVMESEPEDGVVLELINECKELCWCRARHYDQGNLKFLKKYQPSILIEKFEDLKKLDGVKSGRWTARWNQDLLFSDGALFVDADGIVAALIEDEGFDSCKYILQDLGFGIRFE